MRSLASLEIPPQASSSKQYCPRLIFSNIRFWSSSGVVVVIVVSWVVVV